MKVLTDSGLTTFWNKIKSYVSGNVYNPDNEDISSYTSSGSKILRLADRTYNASNFSGKGYKILRKNIKTINNVKKNVLEQSMINSANTIYEIRYDFDLNGATITIPSGCTLTFEGGSLSNGTVKLNETEINASSKCLYNIEIIGVLYRSINLECFDTISKSTMTVILNQSNLDIYLEKGKEYRFNGIILIQNVSNLKIFGNNATIINTDTEIITSSNNMRENSGILNFSYCDNIEISNLDVKLSYEFKERPDNESSEQNNSASKEYFRFRYSTYSCLYFKNCSNLNITDCNLYKGRTPLFVEQCNKVIVRNVTSTESSADGMAFSGHDIFVEACTVRKSQDDIYSVWGYDKDNRPNNIIFSNCDAFDCKGVGFIFANADNCHAKGCRIINHTRFPFLIGYLTDIGNEGENNRNNICTIDNCYFETNRLEDYESSYTIRGKLNIGISITNSIFVNRNPDSICNYGLSCDNILFYNCSFFYYNVNIYRSCSLSNVRIYDGGGIIINSIPVDNKVIIDSCTIFCPNNISNNYKPFFIYKNTGIVNVMNLTVDLESEFTYIEENKGTIFIDTNCIVEARNCEAGSISGKSIRLAPNTSLSQYSGYTTLIFKNNIFDSIGNNIARLKSVYSDSKEQATKEGVLIFNMNNKTIDFMVNNQNFSIPVIGAYSNDNMNLYSHNDYEASFNVSSLKPMWRYDGKWLDANGFPIEKLHKGTTNKRPTGIDEGFEYYDSSIKKKILWNGSAWVNMDGTSL